MRHFWHLVLGTLFACGLMGQPGESVNRVPPPLYASSIEPLLTPLEDVIDGWRQFPDDDESGVTLLDEKLLYTGTAGTRYRLYRQLSWARDEAGAEAMAKRIYRYDKERETIFLVRAEVILSDGSTQPLAERACFIQTPQHEAANSLYTSKAELSMLFPNVQAGSIVHSIVLIREDTPIFPDEFSTSFGFGGNWPAFREGLHVVQPAEEFARVKEVRTGADLPPRLLEELSGGYVHASWRGGQRTSTPWEIASPGFLFRAPAIHLTTIENWDTIARWFEDLVDGRNALGPALEAEVDAWTEGLTDPREILHILTEKVANDVRYTGLEFGLAGYQPYPCETVWKNRYGDCKDKANLLRAMLQHKGIKAYMVLLQSGGHGLVEKRCPNWYQFNHAITAVELVPGEYTFCDPTIERLPAQRVGMGDAERDVLIVKDGAAVWARTPDTRDSAIHLKIEAELEPTGAIRGWFTLHAEGVDAAYYANHYAEMDDRDRRRTMQSTLEAFFPGAEVIDAAFETPAGSVETCDIRTYFVRPGLATPSLSVSFPYPLSWLPPLSPDAERQWPYQIGRRTEGVDAILRLPSGMGPEKLPPAFATAADHSTFQASWQVVDGALHASLAYAPTQRVFQPSEYAEFHRAVRSLATWLESSLNLVEGDSRDFSNTTTSPLEDFPTLSDAEAQLRLIEQRYPEDNGKELRRKALEKIAQWFPDDANGVFESKVKLIQLDTTAENSGARAEQYRQLLDKYRSSVSSRNGAWAKFLEARERFYDRADPDAIGMLIDLAENTELEPFRRGWSAYTAARFLMQLGRSDEALALLRDHDDYSCEAQQSIINDEALWYAVAGKTKPFVAWADDFIATHHLEADRLLANALLYILENLPDIPAEYRPSMANAWRRIDRTVGHFPALSGAFESLHDVMRRSGVRRAIVEAVEPILKREKPRWWTRRENPDLGSTAELIAAIKTNNHGSEVVDAFLQLVFYHEPAYDVLVEQMRRAMWYLNDEHLQPELFDALAIVALQMPETNAPAILGCWRLVAKQAYEEGDLASARAIYKRIVESDLGAKHFVAKSADALASIELEQGNVDDALRAMAISEQYHASHVDGGDFLLRQMFLRLERGEFDRVEELYRQLSEIDQKYINGTDYHTQINQFLKMPNDAALRRAYWERPKTWIQDWNHILSDHGIAPLATSEIPLIRDFDALKNRLEALAKKPDPQPILAELRIFEANARWLPRFVTEFGLQVDAATNIPAELRRQLYACIVKMTENAPPQDEDLDTDFRVFHLDALENSGRHADALAEGRAMFEEGGIGTPLGSSGLRDWLRCSVGAKADARAPTTIALGILEGPVEVYQREDLVGQLSDTLQSVGMNAANLKMIEQELSGSRSHFKDWRRKILRERMESLRSGISGGRAFAQTVDRWIHKNHFDWIEEIDVGSLDDPRFAEVQGIATRSNTSVSYSEILKYNYLLATNPEIEAQRRHLAFANVFFLLTFSARSSGEYRDCVASALNQTAIPGASRVPMFKDGIGQLCRYGHPDQARSLLKLRAGKAILLKHPNLDTPFERWLRAAEALESNAVEDLEAAALELVAAPVQHFDERLLRDLMERLVFCGHPESAERIYKATAGLTFASNNGANRNLAQFRFDWKRRLRNDQLNALFYRHTRDLILKAHGKPVRRNKLAKNDSNAYRSTWGADEDDIAEYYLWMLEGGRLNGSSWEFAIRELNEETSFQIRHRGVGSEILAYALETDVPDHIRAPWISCARSCVDNDVERTRARCRAMLHAFRDNPIHQNERASLAEVAEFLAEIDLRTSAAERPDGLFERANVHLIDENKLALMRLRYGVSRADQNAIEAAWDAIGVDQLTSLVWIDVVNRAISHLGADDEGLLLRQTAEDRARRAARDLWLNPLPGQARRVLAAAMELNLPDLLPIATYKHLLKIHKGNVSADQIRYDYAKAHDDWSAVDRALTAILKRFPKRYDLFLDRARVAHRKKRLKAALKDLEVFLKYSRDAPEYPEAVQLKQQIEAEL